MLDTTSLATMQMEEKYTMAMIGRGTVVVPEAGKILDDCSMYGMKDRRNILCRVAIMLLLCVVTVTILGLFMNTSNRVGLKVDPAILCLAV